MSNFFHAYAVKVMNTRFIKILQFIELNQLKSLTLAVGFTYRDFNTNLFNHL